MAKRKLFAVDLFCGAGGTSTGLAQACIEKRVEVNLLAINHWQIAIDTHSAAHPWAKHLCASLEHVKPTEAVPGGRLHILAGSPECTHHSVARGGRPINDQSRATAWTILKWAQELYIDNILIENVKEFRDWGPIGVNNRPLKSRKGETFNAFINSLRSLGYNVEHRVLNAADYGDATTRERLFVLARRGNKPILWPDRTHSRDGNDSLFGSLPKWKSAREIIDWDVASSSIFERKRPLAPTTMARIVAGLRKFGGAKAEPFIVVLRNHGTPHSVDEPIPTLTAGGNHMALCEPFILGQFGERRARSVDEPLRTITTTSRGVALIEPFLVGCGGPTGAARPKSVDQPLNTILTDNHIGLVEPYLISVNHGEGDSTRRAHSVDDPLPTVTTKNGYALCEPFITKYYGTAKAVSVEEPLDTVTTKDRFALVEPDYDGYRLDIRFRMLQPHELAAAQSFPADYPFTGNKSEIVKQIGNAVPVSIAKSLIQPMIA